MKQLSVIILTYNSEKDIYDCLCSVYQYNDIGDDLEVIVVDNQSQGYKAMYERLAKEYPQVHTIQNTYNGGYGQGNNVGIRIAQAPIVAIMNPDVRLVVPCFKTMLQQFDNPQVVMCGGKQMYPNGKPGWSFAYDFTAMGCFQVFLRRLMQHLECYDEQRMWLSGAFFAIQKSTFLSIGMFDERIFMYGEECDIHHRLRQQFADKHIRYLPSLRYLHLSHERSFSLQRYMQQIQACIYVCRKHNMSISRYLRITQYSNYLCYIRACLCKDNVEKHTVKQQINYIRSLKHTK